MEYSDEIPPLIRDPFAAWRAGRDAGREAEAQLRVERDRWHALFRLAVARCRKLRAGLDQAALVINEARQ